MKIKFKDVFDAPAHVYQPGHAYEVDDTAAKQYIADGVAEEVSADYEAPTVEPPENAARPEKPKTRRTSGVRSKPYIDDAPEP